MAVERYATERIGTSPWVTVSTPIKPDSIVAVPNLSNNMLIRTTNKIEPSISYISPNGDTARLEEEIEKLKENMNRKLNITMLHGCRNCGGQVEVDIDKPIFCCKYCGTSYVIGTVQQNSTY